MERKEKYTILKAALDNIEIQLSEKQYEQLLDYYELLSEKNKVMNLTAITEFEEVVEKHFVDSLIFSKKLVEKKHDVSLIDVGTGAGFPGIPIKIVYPSVRVLLLDSLKKRIGFLNEVIEELKLHDIQGIHGRAEDIGRNPQYREQFDYCVSRAVANLAVLAEYCMPFVKVGGYFIPYKSGAVEEEVKAASQAIRILGGKVEEIKLYELPDTDMGRSLVYIKKEQPIKSKYPRKAGMPAKEPLK